MSQAFHLGGWGMFPITCFGLLTLGVSVRYAIRPERRLVPLQICLGLVTLLAGALGFATGLSKSLRAIGGVPPGEQYVWLIGMGESLVDLVYAFGLLLLATLVVSVGALRLARMSDPGTATAASSTR
jgi:hypothetical protein